MICGLWRSGGAVIVVSVRTGTRLGWWAGQGRTGELKREMRIETSLLFLLCSMLLCETE